MLVLVTLAFLIGFFAHKLIGEYRMWLISREADHWRWKMLLRDEIVSRLPRDDGDPLNPKGEAEVLMEIAADYTNDVQLYCLAVIGAWSRKGRNPGDIVQALCSAAAASTGAARSRR